MTTQIHFDDVEIDSKISPQLNSPSSVSLFRFSALTWNAHRIHYDRDYAIAEGHPDILVQAHLHGAYLARLVTDWMGTDGKLVSIEWRNRNRAFPGDVLTCSGVVKQKLLKGDSGRIQIELTETNQKGELCASGSAEVALPQRTKAGVQS